MKEKSMRVTTMFIAVTLVTAGLAGTGFAEAVKANAAATEEATTVAVPAEEVEAEAASADEARTTGKFDMAVHGRLQWLGVTQKVNDDFRNDERMYLFMKQARVRLQGRYDETTFDRSEEHTSELQSRLHLVCRLLLEKKKQK